MMQETSDGTLVWLLGRPQDRPAASSCYWHRQQKKRCILPQPRGEGNVACWCGKKPTRGCGDRFR